MIGSLPDTLNVCGSEYKICPDYRIALIIFEAYDDPELTPFDKTAIMIQSLFESPEDIPPQHMKEACSAAAWFLDGGKEYDGSEEKVRASDGKLISWTQDESMIFAAVNKAAGCEVRALPFMHWWTFLGYFGEIGECLFSTVVSIRQKKAHNKPLDKCEQQFYSKNREIINIRKKYSAAEQAQIDKLNALLG